MKWKWFSIFMVMCFLLVGCGEDRLQKDLSNYVNNSLGELAVQEEEALAMYESVSGENYTDDQTMYLALTEEVIPMYRDFIADLESVEVETDELRALHEQYIDAANLQQSAFLTLAQGLIEGDYTMVDEANQKLATAKKMIRDYLNEMNVLMEENGLELQ